MATIEAQRYQDSYKPLEKTAAAAYTGGEVHQCGDGRPTVVLTDVASGATFSPEDKGTYIVQKTASIALLEGLPVYWDHSANKAHYKKVNDRDFYLGVCAADAAASATTVKVHVGLQPTWDIDLLRDAALSVPTGTQAVGGFGYPKPFGGAQGLALTATNEAQCIDLLSVDRFAVGAKAIGQFIIRPAANGSTSDVDFNIGFANGTSTTDADTITESLFFHIDGGSTNINAESDDGTTEVAATDTTADISAGSAVANRSELWIDLRDSSDAKFYVDGVEVLSGTANLGNIAAATGPLGILVHLEKASGTATAGPFYIDAARCTLRQQS